MKLIRKALRDLSLAQGVTGDEGSAALVAEKFLRPLVDETHMDALGNLYGIRRSKDPQAKTVLLDAHMDEVGMMVTGQEDGLLKFNTCVGGVDHRLLPNLAVKVLTDPVLEGVITCPLSLGQTKEEQGKPFELEDLMIDCGLSEEEAKKIPVGTRVCYGTEPWFVGNRFFGKSTDDRACFVALLYAMELLKDVELPVNVVVLGSVQEEETGLGALAGTFRMEPDVAFVTDVTFGDSPDSPKDHSVPLGGGCAIGYSPMLDRYYTAFLQELAIKHQIPYAQEVMEGSTGTNSMHTQIAGIGVPSVLVSLPQRYMHTPVESVDLGDIMALGKLVSVFLTDFKEADR